MNKILQFSIFIMLFTAVGIFVNGTTTITDNKVETIGLGNFTNISVSNIDKTGIIYPNSNGVSSTGLIAYYPFTKDSQDYSGQGNNGNNSLYVGFESSKFGNGINLNGSDYINLGTGLSNLETSPITVCLWYKTTGGDGTFRHLVDIHSSSNIGSFNLRLDNNNHFIFYVMNGSTSTGVSTDDNNDGKWHFGCGLRFNTTLEQVYMDGVNKANNTISSMNISSPGLSMLIGARSPSNPNLFFNGSIDEVMIFGRGLSAEEIKSLYEKNYELFALDGYVKDTLNTIYVYNNGTDLPTQLNSYLTQANKKIIVEPGSYSSANSIIINANYINLDMSRVSFTYTGTDSAVLINGSYGYFDIDRIISTGSGKAGVEAKSSSYNYIKIGAIYNAFSLAEILINNTASVGGNNEWQVGYTQGNYITKYGIYFPDIPAFGYEGDQFDIGMMLNINDTFIRIGDNGSADREHYRFDVGFDATNGAQHYIQSHNSKSSFYVKSFTDTMYSTFIVFNSTAHQNLVVSSRNIITLDDQGENNSILSPNSRINNVNITNNANIVSNLTLGTMLLGGAGADLKIGTKLFMLNGTGYIGDTGSDISSYCQFDNTLAGTYTLFCMKGGNGRDVLQLKKASTGGTGDILEAFEGTNTVFKILAGGGIFSNISGTSTMGNLTISANQFFSLAGNTSAILCGASSAGSIYYNSNIKMHYGCNSTNWNALY